MRGLLSELSIPWNREQTDSLTQGIIEAGPRYLFDVSFAPANVPTPSDSTVSNRPQLRSDGRGMVSISEGRSRPSMGSAA